MQTEFRNPSSGRRVQETQQDAHRSLTVKELTAKQKMVIESFTTAGRHLTREDIAAITNMKLSSVCGRVRELLDANRLVVVGKRECPATSSSQQLLALTPQ
jgi:hypothetical protein